MLKPRPESGLIATIRIMHNDVPEGAQSHVVVQDVLEMLVPDLRPLEVPAVGRVDGDDQESTSDIRPGLGSLGLLDGLVLLHRLDDSAALQVDESVETGKVRGLEDGMRCHVGQLVTPDRDWELAHVLDCLSLDALAVQVVLDVVVLGWNERQVDEIVGDLPEGEESQNRRTDIATGQHVSRSAGRIDEDETGSGDQCGVSILAELVDDVDRQQATHGTADEHELVVPSVGIQAQDDGFDHVGCVEPSSCVGDGHDIAVLQPGLTERAG